MSKITDYNTYNFCFIKYPAGDLPIDETLNTFYEGFIETNYLFIDKLLRNSNDRNNDVCKAKFFIISLAVLYYLNNNTKNFDFLEKNYNINLTKTDKAQTITDIYNSIKPCSDDSGVTSSVTADIGFITPAPAPPAVTSPENASSGDDINNLLIHIMKNIMLATNEDFNKVTIVYNSIMK
jgi:hypothetical protein